jgi:hypothetical protein
MRNETMRRFLMRRRRPYVLVDNSHMPDTNPDNSQVITLPLFVTRFKLGSDIPLGKEVKITPEAQ